MPTPSENIKAVAPALQAIADALVDGIRIALADANLDGTKLQQSIEAEVSNGDTVTAYMIEYGQWVVSGRRKFAKKVPIAALLDWIKRKGISGRNAKGRFITHNSLAFAIQNGIYKNGIAGRDFVSPAIGKDFLDLCEKVILDALEREVDRAFATT